MTSTQKLSKLFNAGDYLLSSREDDHHLVHLHKQSQSGLVLRPGDVRFVETLYALNFGRAA